MTPERLSRLLQEFLGREELDPITLAQLREILGALVAAEEEEADEDFSRYIL